jgi:U32 family peptidase
MGSQGEMENKPFKVLAPFNSIDEIGPLKNVGADELYCGYITPEFAKRWPLAFYILNRRGEGQSFEDYGIFKKAVKAAENSDLPVYVTVNGLYTPEQYPFLLELIKRLEDLRGVKGVIVADVGFLLVLKQVHFKKEIHISTGGTCFNSYTADFFQHLGARRIILDRQLTGQEIESIITKKETNIDIDIFIIGSSCSGFIDGYCTFFHCFEEPKIFKTRRGLQVASSFTINPNERVGCNSYFGHLGKKRFEVFKADSGRKAVNFLQMKPHANRGRLGCRICDLYGLRRYPIRGMKIVGRGHHLFKKTMELTKIVACATSLLEKKDISRDRFQKECRDLVSKMLGRRCSKYDCYFFRR